MLGLVPRAGEVGDLVLDKSRPVQPLRRPQQPVRLVVPAGQEGELPPGQTAGQGGVLLHGQAVAGQMIGFQREGVLHRPPPALPALSGQAADQVQGQVFKPRRPGHGDRPVPLEDGVGAADGGQLLRAGGLEAQGQPVKARPAQGVQSVQVHAVRVGLQGDLRPGLEGKGLPQGLERRTQPLRPVPAGGPAAEVDRVRRQGTGALRHAPEVGQKGALVLLHPALPAGQGIEVAVAALAAAEGDVEVDPQLIPHAPAPPAAPSTGRSPRRRASASPPWGRGPGSPPWGRQAGRSA